MGKSAVVLELDSSNVTLLTEEGAFLRIPAKRLPVARYVGQQVDLAELKSPHCGRWLSLAAACLIFILVIPLFRPTPAHAWVTLDGSSSLEVLLDGRFRVLEVRALNSAGQLFLADFPRCEDFSTLVAIYLDWASKSGDDRVLITATAPAGKISQVVSQASQPVDIVLIEVHPKAREEADKLGLSTGRALFVAGADGQGIDISPAQIKEGNPFATLTNAGANIDQVISSSSNPETQVEKIRELPKPEPDPSEESARGGQSRAPKQAPGTGGKSAKKGTPPGLAGKSTPPGHRGKDLPPGLAKKLIQAGRNTPPGLASRGIAPGPAGKNSPTGLAGKDTSSGKAGKNSPPGLAGKDTPPGLARKQTSDLPGKNTPPGLAGKVLPPGQAKKEKERIQPSFGLVEKSLAQPTKLVSARKEEKVGPPFKGKGAQNDKKKGNGNSKGKGNGNGNQGKGNQGKKNNKM